MADGFLLAVMRLGSCFVKTIFCCAMLLLACADGFSQSYGLGFLSYDAVQDSRTSLDLSPGKTLCFKNNFELSFDFTFLPNKGTYFGYVVRIIEDDRRNIDLVYSADRPAAPHRFNLVVGEKTTNVSFDIDTAKLYYTWNKIRIKLDVDNDRIVFYTGNTSFTEKDLHLKKGSCYKILFGVTNYLKFKTTDTPPMKVRDIRILEGSKLSYNWPLDEENGQTAHDKAGQSDALVTNPLWITALHHDWQLVKSFTVNGRASAAFDRTGEALYIVSSDSLYRYDAAKMQWVNLVYQDGALILNTGNQSVFDPFRHNLYNFFIDQKLVNRYDPVHRSWSAHAGVAPVTDFWHVNKFVSSADTSLYAIGGYGHLRYKNQVQKLNLATHSWQQVKAGGDFFMPRYLSALGSNYAGDTAYIIGGYGNKTGQQILNPKNIYDMVRFTPADKRFKHLFELNVKTEDFAFANSLVIDDKHQHYYGLVFSQLKYNSSLQLLCGSLTGPDYKLIGGTIPYAFHDIDSFADLFYSPASKKFIVITLLSTNANQTQVKVYSLLSPPYGTITAPVIAANRSTIFYILIIGGASLAVVLILIGYKWQKARRPAAPVVAPVAPVAPEPVVQTASPSINAFVPNEQYKNSILLFGDLQVFDAEGTEITKHFTPLVKELFLLILLYSVRWGRGVSSEKLNEILWYDKSAESARNNRSVNIAKLKNLLEKMTGCHLSKDTGYWKIAIDYSTIYVDYHNYLAIVNAKKELNEQQIKDLSVITQRGNFLSNIEYEWLDSFKSDIANEVIDTYLNFAQAEKASHDKELLIEIANFIFHFDPVNEEAMIMKCRALFNLGKHSLAKHTFESFCKEYKSIYGEDFKRDFHDILE